MIYNPDGAHHGLEGYKELYDTWTRAFPNLHFTIEDQVAEGSKVMTLFTFSGTHSGKLGEIDPTGREVSVTGVLVCRFAEGKVVEEKGVWDSLRLMQQLGVVPD